MLKNNGPDGVDPDTTYNVFIEMQSYMLKDSRKYYCKGDRWKVMAEHGKFVMDNLYSKIGERYQWGPNQRANISHIDSISQLVAITSDAELSYLFDANLLERQINLFVNIEDNMNEIMDGEHVQVAKHVACSMDLCLTQA